MVAGAAPHCLWDSWDSWERNCRETTRAQAFGGVGIPGPSAAIIPHSALCGLQGSGLLGPLNPVGDFLQVGLFASANDLQAVFGLGVGTD